MPIDWAQQPTNPFTRELQRARGTAGGRPTQGQRGLGNIKPVPDESNLERGAREGRFGIDFVPQYRASSPAQRPRPPRAARAPQVLGSGRAAVDLNHTPYTAREGRAADRQVSIQRIRPFDPLTENGIALTTAQARHLRVRVGDVVTIRDTRTGQTFQATYYDNAGVRRGADNLGHFEVDPALADTLGISYRRRGQVVNAVTNSRQVDGRFRIER